MAVAAADDVGHAVGAEDVFKAADHGRHGQISESCAVEQEAAVAILHGERVAERAIARAERALKSVVQTAFGRFMAVVGRGACVRRRRGFLLGSTRPCCWRLR